MGVEAGPSGAIAVVGPSISIVNEGPIARSALENTMPHTIGEITFNEKPLVTQAQPELKTLDVISEAESILATNKPNPEPVIPTVPAELVQTDSLSKEAVLEEALHWLGGVVVENQGLNLTQRISRQSEPIPGFASSSALAESSRSYQQSEPRLASSFQQVEEVIEEKRLTREDFKNQIRRVDEDVIQSTRAFLVDQPVLAQVLVETEQAVDKGEKEAERLGLGKKIIGALVARFLPAQHEGNTGGAVKPFEVDGTIPARKEAIKATKEFASKKEVKAVILENRPVTIGEEGERASRNEIRTTFRDLIVKPTKLVEIVEKRIVRKRREVSSNNLEDLDLEEVFSKAAVLTD